MVTYLTGASIPIAASGKVGGEDESLSRSQRTLSSHNDCPFIRDRIGFSGASLSSSILRTGFMVLEVSRCCWLRNPMEKVCVSFSLGLLCCASSKCHNGCLVRSSPTTHVTHLGFTPIQSRKVFGYSRDILLRP